MQLYIRTIIQHRVLVLGLIGALTVLLGVIVSNGVIASSMINFLGNTPKYFDYLERVREFGNDEVIIIAFEKNGLLSPDTINKLQKIVHGLERLEEVQRVHSILDVQHISVTDEALRVEKYSSLARSQPDNVPALISKLTQDPLASGFVVSADGKHTVVAIELTVDENRGTETYPDLMKEILTIFREHGLEGTPLHQAGMVAVLAEVMHQTEFNISRLFPVVCLVLLATVYILFRRLWPVFITGVVALVGVIWTMGVAVLLFQKINILLAMAPLFILIISFSDVVHLCSSYMLELSQGMAKDEAIAKSCSEVGTACVYTSLTTFAGFISIALIAVPISRQLGLVLGFGVAVSLLLAMTMTPILFSVMKKPKPWRLGATSRVQGLLDSSLDFMRRFAVSKPWLVVITFSLLMALAVAGMFRIEFEVDFAKRFSEDNHIRLDERYFISHFAGSNYLNIYLETSGPGGILDPELFQKIADYQTRLSNLPEIEKVVSIIDLMRTVHAEFQSQSGEGQDLPDSRAMLAQYLLLFEMSGGEDLERLIDFKRSTISMVAHLPDEGILSTQKTGDKALALARECFEGKLQVEIMSLKYLLGKEFDTLFISGQRKAFFVAVLTVLVMMVIALKSLPAGLWSMIPNVIPLLLLGGYFGWFWDKIDTDSLIVFLAAIGIGVDDTIHFLMRYRFARRNSPTTAAAIQQTFHYSGRAIVMTSLILVAGFMPFAISDYFTIDIMGTLLPGCLIVALLADLLLVPALISLGGFGSRRTSD